jgi:hypothetical protein
MFYSGIKAVTEDPERDLATTKTLYQSLSIPDFNIDSFHHGRADLRHDNSYDRYSNVVSFDKAKGLIPMLKAS